MIMMENQFDCYWLWIRLGSTVIWGQKKKDISEKKVTNAAKSPSIMLQI